MNLLARIERLEALTEDLHENLAGTGDELRLTADGMKFPYEKVLQIWRHELGGQPLDYGGSLLLLDAVRHAKAACETSASPAVVYRNRSRSIISTEPFVVRRDARPP